MRKAALLWLFLATLCGGILFQTSQHVTDGRQKLAGIEAETKKEDASIRVLQAEWSYLNSPDRLEKLSKKYLALEPLKGAQFGKVEALEARPPEAPAAEATPAVADVAPLKPAAPEKAPAPKTAAAKPVPEKLPVIVLKPETAVASPILKPPAATPRYAPATAWREPPRTAGDRDFRDVMKSLGVQ